MASSWIVFDEMAGPTEHNWALQRSAAKQQKRLASQGNGTGERAIRDGKLHSGQLD